MGTQCEWEEFEIKYTHKKKTEKLLAKFVCGYLRLGKCVLMLADIFSCQSFFPIWNDAKQKDLRTIQIEYGNYYTH